MIEMIAYCGLTCRTCLIYPATRQENKEEQARMRAEIVRLCQEHYGIHYELKDIIDGDGCTVEHGRLFSSCKNCSIRKCSKRKRLENCAYCPEYAREKLKAFFATDPAAKGRLDEIRNNIP